MNLGIMVLPEVKFSGGKLIPHPSNHLGMMTTSERTKTKTAGTNEMFAHLQIGTNCPYEHGSTSV